MPFHKGSQASNFTQCLNNTKNNAIATNNFNGLLNGDGGTPANASDVTAISYSMCISNYGTGQEPFQWSVFSQEFSAWLLPNLALILQLPFGAQYRIDNLMSALLTVDSRFAVSILSSLQQVPLRFYPNPSRLYSFIALPENDSWWKCLAEFVDYTHTWSIASATSVAWVVVAYILTVANSVSDVYANVQSNGEASGSMWLWLIPIVAGWLQLSPKCDFNRLHAAYDRADHHSLRAGTADVRTGMLPASSRRALAITAKEEDVMSPDEFLNPPVFNYSRSLRWGYTAETICLVFKVASEKAHVGTNRSDTTTDDCGALMHNPQPGEAQSSHWAPSVLTRMAIASCASLALQWGTVGAALLVSWFTPTTGIGCRTMGYFLYGVISTLIWMMLLMSSILAHYSAAYSHRPPPSARVALALSHCLRWTGKLCAYSNFYDRCFCNSSVFSRRGGAYAVIIETAAEAKRTKAAWIGALALACTSASVFLGVVYLLLDTVPS
ncbi:hypothetical protein BD769DRAFT_1623497 [Suillus cothurnatus]|nr:hypothetical protein BD769DRAFT_1623497 [Suillus cothurnatus]